MTSWKLRLHTLASMLLLALIAATLMILLPATSAEPSFANTLAQVEPTHSPTYTYTPTRTYTPGTPGTPLTSTPTDTVTVTPTAKPCNLLLSEGFEDRAYQFTSVITGCPGGGCGWFRLSGAGHSGNYAIAAPDVSGVSDQKLEQNNTVPVYSDSILTFWHHYGFEFDGHFFYDGGVLEYSTDNGSTWFDAGSLITSGGYNATISSCCGNPLAGRQAWGFLQSSFQQVTVNLAPLAGQNVKIRFRLGTDSSGASDRWYIDDIAITGGPCGTPAPTSTSTPTATPPSCGTASNYVVTQFSGASITSGINDSGNHTDDGITQETFPLGFTFSLYGVPYTRVNVSSNGNAQFATQVTDYNNTCLPAATFGPTIFPFWDDLRTDTGSNCAAYPGGTCGVYTSVSGVAPNRIYNIEWRAVQYPNGAQENFELRLHETTNVIEVVYGANDGGGSATVGVQGGTGSQWTEFSCNTLSISNGMELTFEQQPCTTPTQTPTGTIAPSETPTPTGTDTPGPINSNTPTATPPSVPTNTDTPTPALTNTFTPVPTNTPRRTTRTPTFTVTPTPTINPCILNPPAIIYPQSGAVFPPTTTQVTLDWSDVTCATTYELEVRQRNNACTGTPMVSATTAGSQYTLGVVRNNTYWWRVRACDAAGCGAWTTCTSFSVSR